MKNKILTLTISTAIALSVVSCGPGGFNKQQGGTALGAIGGGIAGNQFGKGSGKTAATIGGAVLGGVVGNSVGTSLDKADSNYNSQGPNVGYVDNGLSNVLENNRTNETASWRNPDGSRVSITPTRTYNGYNGMPCRDYVINNPYGGQSYGSACRQPNGGWVGN